VQAAESVLKNQEINARVDAIKSRQQRLKSAIERQKNALGDLFNLSLESEDALRDALVKASRLREIFVGTRDHSEVSEIVIQLERLLSDLSAWENSDVSVERLEELLQIRMQSQLAEMEDFLCLQGIDAAWDIRKIYDALKLDRIDKARRRSAAWLAPRLISDVQLCALTKVRSAAFATELSDVPVYLSEVERTQVELLLNSVHCRLAEIEEKDRRERVAIWQQRFFDFGDIQKLSKLETEQLVRALHNPPDELLPNEHAMLHLIESQLTTHLDQMGVDELAERIGRLSLDAQHKLLAVLSELMAKNTALVIGT
jgi:uncharacterized small protein (DUF1192 family)